MGGTQGDRCGLGKNDVIYWIHFLPLLLTFRALNFYFISQSCVIYYDVNIKKTDNLLVVELKLIRLLNYKNPLKC